MIDDFIKCGNESWMLVYIESLTQNENISTIKGKYPTKTTNI